MHFPRHSQQRKVIFITVCFQFFRHLINVLSHINNKPWCMIPVQLLCQMHPVFFFRKAKPGCHCKLLSPEILYDRCILKKMYPADRIGPSIFSGQKLHFISGFCCQHHILYCKTHKTSLFVIQTHSVKCSNFFFIISYILCWQHIFFPWFLESTPIVFSQFCARI